MRHVWFSSFVARVTPLRGQRPQAVGYDGLLVDCGYRLDLLVEEEVVVELKATARVTKLDERQLLTYLRLSDSRVGLLINFNVLTLVEGVKRLVNDFPDASPGSPLRSPRSLRLNQA
jgi:GxxExxY protein